MHGGVGDRWSSSLKKIVAMGVARQPANTQNRREPLTSASDVRLQEEMGARVQGEGAEQVAEHDPQRLPGCP